MLLLTLKKQNLMNHSVSDLNDQTHNLEAKLTTGFVNIAVALRAMLWQECLAVNLSPIQGQIIIYCLNHPPQLCRIGYLAKEFCLTKPTISDAVKTLERKNLLNKFNDQGDLRSINLILTEEGRKIAQQVSGFADPLQSLIAELPETRKNQLEQVLVQFTVKLKEMGALSGQRSCVSCQHSSKPGNRKSYFCNLFQEKMAPIDIRLNCQSYVAS